MNRYCGHILITLVAFVSILSSCGRDEAEVIPRGDLAQIYAEMLLTDQWVMSTPNVRKIADTSLVYEPILEKYGYDSDDYRKSVDVYMDDPERFARIFRETSDILDRRLTDLKRQKEIQEKEMLRRKEMEKYRSNFKPEEFFPYLFDEPYIHYYDSVSFEPDSILQIYRLTPIERADTIYDRIEMIILRSDTLAAADTIAASDTLMIADTLVVTDTLAAADTMAASDILTISDTLAVSDTLAAKDTVDKKFNLKKSDVRKIKFRNKEITNGNK